MFLFQRYNKICNSTSIQVGRFMCLTSHCLYANAVVQPSVQHRPCPDMEDKGPY